MKLYKTLLLALVFLMPACSPLNNAINPYNEDFKCKAKDDAGECIDTPTAYQKARHPEMDDADIRSKSVLKQDLQENRYKILSELLQEEKKPVLHPPKILRVLLLPYKGENQELFMTRYIYVKIENSDWILTDLTEK